MPRWRRCAWRSNRATGQGTPGLPRGVGLQGAGCAGNAVPAGSDNAGRNQAVRSVAARHRPMQRLIHELQRLFLQPGRSAPETAPPGSDALQADLGPQLAGGQAALLPPDDGHGATRVMVLRFDGVARGQGEAHCTALLQLARALMEDLGLPEPAISVNGREGYRLWLSLAAPVPVAAARDFLQGLMAAYLKDLAWVAGWPDAGQAPSSPLSGEPLAPSRHAGSGLWAVFIAPGLARSFTEEAGIDVPPNLDKQAELLAGLEPIAVPDFMQAAQRLRARLGDDAGNVPAPAAVTVPPSPLGAPLAARRDEIFRALARDPSETVVATPFPSLSRLLHGGLRSGRAYVLLAPPKAGKTMLAMTWLEHAAAHGHPALYVGYEMAREQLIHAALARRLRLESWRIEARALTAAEAERAATCLEAYLGREGHFLEVWEAGPATGFAEVAAWVRQAREVHPGRTPLVVIDPLELVAAGQVSRDPHPPAPAQRVAACKDLARTSGAAVIALCTLHAAAGDPGLLDADDAVQARAGAADGLFVLQARRPVQSEDMAGQADESGPEPVCLSLLSHRGRTGEVALQRWRAFQALDELAWPGLEAEPDGHDAGSGPAMTVFRRHAGVRSPT